MKSPGAGDARLTTQLSLRVYLETISKAQYPA
jgi:hypothetical protein